MRVVSDFLLPLREDLGPVWKGFWPLLTLFVLDRDPLFAITRSLAQTPDVTAVAYPERPCVYTPGYYYLHRKIPVYCRETMKATGADWTGTISHVVTATEDFSIPGYRLDRRMDDLRVWVRQDNTTPVRQWQAYVPAVSIPVYDRLVRSLYPDVPPLPDDAGIRFVPDQSGTPQGGIRAPVGEKRRKRQPSSHENRLSQ